MTLEEIKSEARNYKANNLKELSDKVLWLKNQGVDFLACVAFVKENQKIYILKEAYDLTLSLDAWTQEERDQRIMAHQIMLSDFEEDLE